VEEWPWNCPPPIYPGTCAWVRSFQWVGCVLSPINVLAAILPRFDNSETEVPARSGTFVMLSAMAVLL
jgi:hypothetical protein